MIKCPWLKPQTIYVFYKEHSLHDIQDKNWKSIVMTKEIKVCKPCKSTQTGTKWTMNKKIIPDAWGHYKILKLSSIGAQECQKTKQNQKTKKQTKKHLKRKCSEVKKNKNKNIEKLW